MNGVEQDVPGYWNNLYRHRWAWGYRMLSAFRANIKTPEYSSLFGDEGKSHIRVAVLGTTRVGKTTLIFKLLGVDDRTLYDGETRLTRLGRILRGNNAKEEAGTSTAIIYRRSHDAYFHFQQDGAEDCCCDEAAIEQRLQQLRKDVEAGRFKSLTPVKISIPGYFFDPDCSYPPLTVIDIPGTDSAVEAEHAHVSTLLHEIVQFSTMILLVEAVFQLTRLKDRKIPGLGNWQHFQDRVRLVLTYSVSDHSALEVVRREKGERGAYLDFFRGELGKAGIRLRDNIPIFPLEYGESWQGFRQEQPALWGKMSILLQALTSELVEEVKRASGEEAAFLLYMSQEKTISERAAERKQQLLDALDRCQAQQKKLEKELSELALGRDKALELQNELAHAAQRLKEVGCEFAEGTIALSLYAPPLDFGHIRELDQHYQTYRSLWHGEASQYCSEQLARAELPCSPKELSLHLDRTLDEFEWRSYADDPSPPSGNWGLNEGTYGGVIFSDDEKKYDHECSVNVCCKEMLQAVSGVAATYLRSVVAAESNVAAQKLREMAAQVKSHTQLVREKEDEVSRAKVKSEGALVSLEAFELQSREDIATASLFRVQFMEALDRECGEHYRVVNDPKVPVEYKTLELAYIYCLSGEIQAKGL